MAWPGRGSGLRATGTRMRHWKNTDRPAFGWDSLTDTERCNRDLVAQGLSNREVASQIFLSAHTVAFHLRHVFWKLGLTSRVQLARLVAEQSTRAPPPLGSRRPPDRPGLAANSAPVREPDKFNHEGLAAGPADNRHASVRRRRKR